jgi:hypothetical protein
LADGHISGRFCLRAMRLLQPGQKEMPQMPDVGRIHCILMPRQWFGNFRVGIVDQFFVDQAAVNGDAASRDGLVDGTKDFAGRRKQFAAEAAHARINRRVGPLDWSEVRHNSLYLDFC